MIGLAEYENSCPARVRGSANDAGKIFGSLRPVRRLCTYPLVRSYLLDESQAEEKYLTSHEVFLCNMAPGHD